MFGLEGSGFIISLAMTFFLVGLVMYYVRQRLNDQEKQLNQLVSIIPVMSQQLQLHEGALKNIQSIDVGRQEGSGGGSLNMNSGLSGIPEEPEKINVSDNDMDESDSESEETDDSDEDTDDDGEVRNIQLGGEIADLTVADIEAELGNQLQAMAMQGGMGEVRVVSVHTMGSEAPEPLVDNSHNIEIIDDKEEDNASTESEDESESNTDEEEDDEGELVDQVEIDDIEALEDANIEIDSTEKDIDEADTMIVHVEPDSHATVDYSKMAVAAIREIVLSKGLANASEVPKLKKKKLLELLK
ncbi:MAG: hypothetical protein ACXABD_00055 [Candidatus Thorarchaeota archaeon]|jgi:hypothetical protein